jgi:hypothetical protein
VCEQGAVALTDQFGYLRLVGGENCRQPTVHEIRRPRHLYVEARQKSDRAFRAEPVIADHPLVHREKPQKAPVSVDPDRRAAEEARAWVPPRRRALPRRYTVGRSG